MCTCNDACQLKDMFKAISLVSYTPWGRLSRSLGAMLRRATSNTSDSAESGNNSVRSTGSNDPLGSPRSSSISDALGMGAREPRDFVHWSQKLGAGIRAVLPGGKKRQLQHAKSDQDLLNQRRLELGKRHMMRRSRSSDSLSGASDGDSLFDDQGPEDVGSDADLLFRSLQDAQDGRSASPRSKTTSPRAQAAARTAASPVWRPPSRGVPVAPFEG